MHNVKSMFIFGNIENYSGTSGLRRKGTQKRGENFLSKNTPDFSVEIPEMAVSTLAMHVKFS